ITSLEHRVTIIPAGQMTPGTAGTPFATPKPKKRPPKKRPLPLSVQFAPDGTPLPPGPNPQTPLGIDGSITPKPPPPKRKRPPPKPKTPIVPPDVAAAANAIIANPALLST